MILSEMTTMQKLMLLHGIVGGKAVEDYASGNPCVFTTDLAKPLRKLSLSLLPRQSGTGDPSPQNIRSLIPWGEVGTWHGGKNILNVSFDTITNGGVTFSKNSDGTIHLQGTIAYQTNYAIVTPRFRLAQAAYTISRTNDNVMLQMTERDSEDNIIARHQLNANSSRTITPASDSSSFEVFVRAIGDNGTNVNLDVGIQLEVGQTATAYESPSITPHPVNVGKNLLNATGTSEYFTVSDGVYTAANVPSDAKSFALGTMKLKKGETYILSGGYSTYLYMSFSYNGTVYSTKGNDSQPFTATGDDTIIIAGVITKTAQVGQKLFPMIRLATEADPTFQPYLPPVYGCELDLTTGEVWGTHVTVDLHKSDFTLEGSGALPYRQTPQAMVFQHKPKSGVNWNKARQQQKLNCALIANPYSETTYGDYIGVCFCDTALPTAVRISLALYNALQDEDTISICYEIETPVLLATLTPQQVNALVGVNTVWSDADGIELTFLKKG